MLSSVLRPWLRPKTASSAQGKRVMRTSSAKSLRTSQLSLEVLEDRLNPAVSVVDGALYITADLFGDSTTVTYNNGNYIVGNCHAGPDNPQLFEVTRDKKVVWTFKDFKTFGNDLASAVVLDAE